MYLKYNMDHFRKKYLDDHPELGLAKNKRKLELILYREWAAAKNPIFVKEWIKIYKLAKDKKIGRDQFREMTGRLKARFDFFRPLRLDAVSRFPGAVRTINADSEGWIELRFDCRFPKQVIMDELKLFVDHWYDSFWEREWINFWSYYPKRKVTDKMNRFGDYISRPVTDEEIERDFKKYKKNKIPVEKVPGNIPKDLNEWDRNLQVWEQKEDKKKTWPEVVEWLKETKLDEAADIQRARNYFKAAEKLIMEGVPGFPPFPKE